MDPPQRLQMKGDDKRGTRELVEANRGVGGCKGLDGRAGVPRASIVDSVAMPAE